MSRVLVSLGLLNLVFLSYSGEAISVANELKDMQEIIKFFIFSFLVEDTLEKVNFFTIVGLLIATVMFLILFRGLIFFMIIFGVLVILFFSTERMTDCLKEKFSFVKIRSDSERDKN